MFGATCGIRSAARSVSKKIQTPAPSNLIGTRTYQGCNCQHAARVPPSGEQLKQHTNSPSPQKNRSRNIPLPRPDTDTSVQDIGRHHWPCADAPHPPLTQPATRVKQGNTKHTHPLHPKPTCNHLPRADGSRRHTSLLANCDTHSRCGLSHHDLASTQTGAAAAATKTEAAAAVALIRPL